MINPTTKGTYKNATIAEAQAVVNFLNDLCFDSLHKASLRYYPTPAYIKRTKFKFVFNSFSKTYDSLAYISTGNANWAPLAAYINDPNAIDIIFKGDAANESYGEADGIPGKAVKMSSNSNQLDTGYVWWGSMELLAHELGHCLGLSHTNYIGNTCVQDFVVEDSATYYGGGGACNPAIDSTHSNNLMNNVFNCRSHLSPRQLALCHYNLRNTFLFNTLTTSSQQRARNTQSYANLNITSDQTWTIDRFFKGNIVVKANKTLTIKCTVAMSRYSRITVEVGAQLIIDGGTVTNLTGELWDGIFLAGNPYLAQLATNSSNPGSLLYQAILRIKNQGTISHASVGVRNYLSNTGNTGGVIFAQNANFIDNVKDVYMATPSGTGIQPSASWFYYCNFKTLSVISHNYAPINHVELRNITGVKIMGCHFLSGANPNTGGNGIFSVDAIYTVDKTGTTPCIFELLNKGIYVNNINPLKTPVIKNSTFTDNFYGAYFMNSNYIAFQNNTLSCVTRSGASEVYLNNCKYYKIKNNQFSHSIAHAPSDEGVTVYKSKTGAHEIFRNTFSNLNIGINCMDDNGNSTNATDGLKMNCNDFHISPNSYDVVLSYSSGLALPRVNKTQGEISSSANSANLVRNIYGAGCGNQNKWQIYSGSTSIIDHGSNTNTITAVTQPILTGCKSQYLNVQNKNINLNYPLHCPAEPPSSGGTSTLSSNRLASMNEYISGLLEQRAEDISEGIIPNDFELQSTVASKLNLFLTDSVLASSQEVINILENNHGYMEDADIQTIFAYMNKGDFETALTKTNLLAQSRADWKDLLTQLISFQQDTVNGIENISTQYIEFFNGYANSANKDGKYLAQALLKAASVSEYNEPHALPEEMPSQRMSNTQTEESSIENLVDSYKVDVFPNPTKTGLNVKYFAKEDGLVKIELKDLLGKLIYSNFSNNRLMSQYISLTDLKAGMYLLSILKDKEVIYSAKIIKED